MSTDDVESGVVGQFPSDWFVSHGSDVEMRWDAVDGDHCTPNERFFVRNHTSTPRVEPATYRLQLYGDGLSGAPTADDPRAFGLDEIRSLPSQTITAALECTGNGRSFFASQQGTLLPGTQWALGAIGVATWTGVALTDLLAYGGVEDSAVAVMATGLDDPYVFEGVDYGNVRRPLPIEKAFDDVLVAYEMNGEALPADHGFPLRLIVPGWVGVASIKWLGSLEVSTRPMESPWTTTFYRMREAGEGDGKVLTEMPVKSAFELGWGATLDVGEPTLLRGRSWSGAGAIESVEVSLDGSVSWITPQLTGPNQPKTWVRWEIPWRPTTPGRYELIARAIDTTGQRQPDWVPANDDGYLFWAVVRHPVEVV